MTIDSTTFGASDRASVGIYRANPPGSDPCPGLLIFPSIFGITTELESHADEIAATGVIVVAFDPFSRGDAGGLFVFNAAADGELAAAATWHGSRMAGLTERASTIQCPMLIEFGDADPVAPIEDINRIAEAFSDADHVQVRIYPGTGHGFSHTGWDDHDAAAMAEARPALEKMLSALRV